MSCLASFASENERTFNSSLLGPRKTFPAKQQIIFCAVLLAWAERSGASLFNYANKLPSAASVPASKNDYFDKPEREGNDCVRFQSNGFISIQLITIRSLSLPQARRNDWLATIYLFTCLSVAGLLYCIRSYEITRRRNISGASARQWSFSLIASISWLASLICWRSSSSSSLWRALERQEALLRNRNHMSSYLKLNYQQWGLLADWKSAPLGPGRKKGRKKWF